MRYYISDLHFGDSDVMNLMDKRDFPDLNTMNEYLISSWNKVADLDKKAEFFVLGDMFNYKNLGVNGINKIIHRLKGRIYLIKGNHDDEWINKPGIDLKRFYWIKEYAEIKDTGREVILCHYPIPFWGKNRSKVDGGKPKVWMLHGHTHKSIEDEWMIHFKNYVDSQTFPDKNGNAVNMRMNIINCFCGKSNYTPLTLDQWICLENPAQSNSNS